MDETRTDIWDTIIIGGGTAGLSAALMLGRARRRVLVIDAGAPRNRFAAHMHGVLGHEGIDPAELLRIGRAEASAYGVAFAGAEVLRVEEGGDGLLVSTGDGLIHACRTLLLATGITDRLPPIPGLAERWGTSVLHCPYCHGWEVRDRRLGVLATSPLSLHQVQLIRQWSEHVVFFASAAGALDDETRARLGARSIRIVDEPVVDVLGEGGEVSGVRLEGGGEIALDAIFTGGIPEPHDRMLAPLDLVRAEGPLGDLIAVDAVGQTSHPDVWAVGNVVNPAANVPLAMGAGSFAGAAVNAALVMREFVSAREETRTPA